LALYREVSNQIVAVEALTNLGIEVLTAVAVKSTVFWDITPYNPVIHKCFGECTASIFRVE
jgi:hypothetical protein